MNIFDDTGININNSIFNHKRVILIGAGSGGKHALETLKQKNIEVIFFCDNDTSKHGMDIDGVKIYPFSSLLKHRQELVLVSSYYYREIADQLRAMGVNNFYFFGFCGEYERWQSHFDPQKLVTSRERITIGRNLFFDETSRNLYDQLIKFRYTLGSKGGGMSSFAEYFHPAVKPEPGDTIIDGGAWTGDTAEAFCRTLNFNCQIYSFEPNDLTFNKLQDNLKQGHYKNHVTPLKLGLWSHTTTLKFNISEENSMANHVSEHGVNQINVISIDEFLSKQNLKVDLIKMDIEGAEIQALHGARKTIERQLPRLQICSYHNFDDLWEIPILIKEFHPEYRLFLGHHSPNNCESIVYAYFPQNK